MTKINVLAQILYSTAGILKGRDYNKFISVKKHRELISSLSAMQFLTHCIGMKSISPSQTDEILSILKNTYGLYKSDDFEITLREASDESDYSTSYEELLFQMHFILSSCIKEANEKNKGYREKISKYLCAFHNLPRVFLSPTDKNRISPDDAMEYAESYLNFK